MERKPLWTYLAPQLALLSYVTVDTLRGFVSVTTILNKGI